MLVSIRFNMIIIDQINFLNIYCKVFRQLSSNTKDLYSQII